MHQNASYNQTRLVTTEYLLVLVYTKEFSEWISLNSVKITQLIKTQKCFGDLG